MAAAAAPLRHQEESTAVEDSRKDKHMYYYYDCDYRYDYRSKYDDQDWLVDSIYYPESEPTRSSNWSDWEIYDNYDSDYPASDELEDEHAEEYPDTEDAAQDTSTYSDVETDGAIPCPEQELREIIDIPVDVPIGDMGTESGRADRNPGPEATAAACPDGNPNDELNPLWF